MIRIAIPIIALLLLAACDTLTGAGTDDQAATDDSRDGWYSDMSGSGDY